MNTESLVGQVITHEGRQGFVTARLDSGAHRVRFTEIVEGKKKTVHRIIHGLQRAR